MSEPGTICLDCQQSTSGRCWRHAIFAGDFGHVSVHEDIATLEAERDALVAHVEALREALENCEHERKCPNCCQDWPPGDECQGCKGMRLKAAALASSPAASLAEHDRGVREATLDELRAMVKGSMLDRDRLEHWITEANCRATLKAQAAAPQEKP